MREKGVGERERKEREKERRERKKGGREREISDSWPHHKQHLRLVRVVEVPDLDRPVKGRRHQNVLRRRVKLDLVSML